MNLKSGTLLHGGTYRIEKELGQGSFGITYLAIHTNLDKKVAIKEFFMKELNSRNEDGSITGMSDGSLSYDYCQKFQKEALNLSRLDHPNIVRVTDSFEDNGTFYYVMDYIEGLNLNDYIKQYSPSESKAVELIRSVAEALIYMHEQKHMLHLDLKPGNIMRRKGDAHIILIDFGLSKHYSNDGKPETSTTIGLGTAGYAPIEQGNRAKSGEFRPTIDVYALGATLYKLVTHDTPPAASDLIDEDVLPELLKSKGVSRDLSSVIINAMMPSVKMRTPSVRAFVEALPEKVCTNRNIVTSVVLKKDEKTQLMGTDTLVSKSTSTNNVDTDATEIVTSNVTSKVTKAKKKLYKHAAQEASKESNSKTKYVFVLVLMAVLGIGAYFMIRPSYEDKYMEAVNLKNGYGVEINKEKAFEIFKELSDKGYGPGTFEVMEAYLSGYGVEEDSLKAEEFKKLAYEQLKKDAEAEDRCAQYYYALCYKYGYGVKESDKEAKKWLEKSAKQNFASAQVDLAILWYFYSDEKSVVDIEVNAKKYGQTILALLKKASEQNNPKAFLWLAKCYSYGIETPMDSSKYVDCLTRAAELGEGESMHLLGICYTKGEGVKKDVQKGFNYLRESVDRGILFARTDLACCYYDGIGTNPDYDEALNLLSVFDEHELYRYEQYVKGLCYFAKNDNVNGLRWCEISAKNGEPNAQVELGNRYAEGNGVPKSKEKSLYWFLTAQENGVDFSE